jgi:RNA polymerase sigma factor (sigma-70 family)
MGQANVLLRHLHRLTANPSPAADTDLLQRFVTRRDEAAFEALVRRHGPLVLRVARRLLRDAHDADDVFQASFLTLARKAGSIHKQASLASWLHGVAYRLALQIRAAHARRTVHESRASAAEQPDALTAITLREAQALLDEELARLPEKYRAPLVLCYLEGNTRDEAAGQLGWSLGTFKRRLEQGRERLRLRLSRRGLALPAVLSAVLVAEGTASAVPPSLLGSTVRAASLIVGGERLTSDLVSAQAIRLLDAVPGTLCLTRMRAAVVLVLGCLATGLAAVGAGLLEDRPPAVSPPPASHPVSKAEGRPPAADLHGDPLPPGALMRLGTVRFRPGETVGQIAFSRDGRLLVSTHQNLEANNNPNAICVWDRATGKRLRTFCRQRNPFLALAVSPDGRTLASQSIPGTVRLWDLTTGQELREVTKGGLASSGPGGPRQRLTGAGCLFSPDGKLVAARAPDLAVHLWEVATGRDVARFVAELADDGPLAFAPDGKTLATSADTTIRLWDVATAREVRQIKGHDGPAGAGAFSADGKRLGAFVAPSDQPFRLTGYVWDVVSGKVLHQVPSALAFFGAAFSPDLKRGLVAGYPTVLFDVATGRRVTQFANLDSNNFAIAFSPDGKTVATGGTGRAIWLWDAETGKPLTPASGHTGIISSLAVSPDGRTLASTASDPEVWLWDLGTGRTRARLRPAGVTISEAAFSPDGRTLAVMGDDAFVRLLDASTGKELSRLEGMPTQTALSFSPDGKLLAAVSRGDGLIRIWDVASGRLRRQLKALPPAKQKPGLLCLAFSPDGRFLVTGGFGPVACVWSVASGERVRELPGHDYWVSSLSFSPDGRVLATTCSDKTIRLWEVLSGKERRRLEGHTKQVRSVAFAPDGRHLASGSDDQTVRVWDYVAGKEVACFHGHDGVVGPLAFSRDGKVLYSGGWDTTILAWDVARLKQPK